MLEYSKQSAKISIKALLANKGRSFLTMLGIIIGVGAVIIIMAVGAGAQSLILSQVEAMGTDIIGILPGASDDKSPPATMLGIVITTLSYDDAMALKEKKNVTNSLDVVAYYKGFGTAIWGANSYDTNLNGCTVGYIEVEGGSLEDGRFFTEEEENNFSKVAVLGSIIKKELFGESEAIGKRIKIKKQSFQVIGVMKERGTVAFQNYDDQIFLPLKTMQKLISGVNHVSMVRVKIDNVKNAENAIFDIKATLRERHNIDDQSGSSDDFSVRSSAEAMQMLTTVTDGLKFFLVAIAALSLLVGGIGIMNIMLVAVSERTREIGLRKAIGARNFDIMSQFLIESVTVTMLGGGIGIAVGLLVSFIIASGAKLLGYNWDFFISAASILLGVGVSMAVGLIFGLFPARRASRLDPIEALRYE